MSIRTFARPRRAFGETSEDGSFDTYPGINCSDRLWLLVGEARGVLLRPDSARRDSAAIRHAPTPTASAAIPTATPRVFPIDGARGGSSASPISIDGARSGSS